MPGRKPARCASDLIGRDNRQTLEIRVEDDGKSIPSEYQAGVGLSSMRERAEGIGGKLVEQSYLRGGTRVTASLPLAAIGSLETAG